MANGSSSDSMSDEMKSLLRNHDDVSNTNMDAIFQQSGTQQHAAIGSFSQANPIGGGANPPLSVTGISTSLGPSGALGGESSRTTHYAASPVSGQGVGGDQAPPLDGDLSAPSELPENLPIGVVPVQATSQYSPPDFGWLDQLIAAPPIPSETPAAADSLVAGGPSQPRGGPVQLLTQQQQEERTVCVHAIPHNISSYNQVGDYFRSFGDVVKVTIDSRRWLQGDGEFVQVTFRDVSGVTAAMINNRGDGNMRGSFWNLAQFCCRE